MNPSLSNPKTKRKKAEEKEENRIRSGLVHDLPD